MVVKVRMIEVVEMIIGIIVVKLKGIMKEIKIIEWKYAIGIIRIKVDLVIIIVELLGEIREIEIFRQF